MSLGQKIKKLRTDKGLTQKDLADQLHVTFQTISKWESSTNEPDITTLKEIAKLFGVTLDYLVDENEESNQVESSEEESSVVASPKEESTTKTIIIHQKDLPVCAKCGKDIEEDDLVAIDQTKHVRSGRHYRSVTIGQTLYHKHCYEELKQEQAAAAQAHRSYKASHSKKICFGWSIPSGVVALALALIIFLTSTDISVGASIALSLLIGYGIFAMVYCILSGSYISEVFVRCAGLSIKFPGIIFSWDLGGFAFLIAMKILFAVLGFLVGVFALLFAIFLSAVLGGISFPFVLIHNIRTEYDDALF